MIWVFSKKADIAVYYLITTTLLLLLQSGVDDFISDSYLTGEMANFLLKPVNFWKIALSKDVSKRFLNVIFSIPALIAMILIVGKQNFSTAVAYLSSPLIFFLIPVSFLLIFLFSGLIGLFCFWTEEVWGLQHVKNLAILFLSGTALPYSFFPEKFVNLLFYTPFPYLTSWPLWASTRNFSLNLFIVPLLWVAVLMCATRYLWVSGMKKYSAMGG